MKHSENVDSQIGNTIDDAVDALEYLTQVLGKRTERLVGIFSTGASWAR